MAAAYYNYEKEVALAMSAVEVIMLVIALVLVYDLGGFHWSGR